MKNIDERINEVKKIAVLGANGYIARNLVYVLKRDYPDFELFLYGRESDNSDNCENYKSVDMTDKNSVKNIDLSCDIVFMFVGKTGSIKGFDEYDSFIDINERTLLNLLTEYLRQGSKAKIIYPSTRLVYKGKQGPQKEEAEKEFKTIYAINKYACEQYLEQFYRVYDVQYSIFRVCIPYGTLIKDASSYGTTEFMLSKATKGDNIILYGDGSVRRTLTYMEDLCKILIEGALSNKCVNDVFNIGGEDYSLKEMANLIANKYGVSIDYIDWPDVALKIESGDTVFDDSKLQKIIKKDYNGRFRKWIEGS